MSQTENRQNPWAGLSSYEDPAKSKQPLKFCGRDRETKEVSRLIDDNFFVTLYGKSGIGKTSLLNAGVFPALRRDQYTSLSMRLGMTDESQTFQEIITQAIEHAITEVGGSVQIINVTDEPSDCTATDYLWRWFARRRFLTADGQITFPVLVFDQFEEVFRQADSRKKAEVLLNQLNYLVDESHAIGDSIVEGKEYSYDFNFRFVLSIREDDLYRLEDSLDNCSLPALKRCRYRLRSLSEQGAREVILIPGEEFFREGEKEQIVEAIVGKEGKGGKARNEDGSISTNIVSLLCNRIFVDFQKSDADHITPALVDNFIKGNPFERFYNEATKGFSNKEKSYIEEHLVDSNSRRNSIPESDFLLHVKNGAKLLEGDKRILQHISTSSDGNNYRIELIHDSFCEPLTGQKEKREKRKRRCQFFVITCIAVFCTLSVIYVMSINHRMNVNMSRVLAEKANQLTDNGDSYLARIVALQALPPNRPYTPEADWALHKASKYDNAILNGHSSFVEYASFSPDGNFIVSASADSTVRIWDVKTGRQVGNPLKGHAGGVNSAFFSPDGKHIVSTSDDKTIRIWDIEKRVQIEQPLAEYHNRVYSALYSPDGKYVVICVRDGIIVWDVEKQKQVGETLRGWIGRSSLTFSPDDKYVISLLVGNTVRLWDMKNDRQVGKPLVHDKTVCSSSFSPDGKYIVSTSYDHTIRLWDVKNRNQVGYIRVDRDSPFFASFSPDSRYVVYSSDDRHINIWDVKEGKQFESPQKGHTNSISTAFYSPDGRFIVSASYDNTVRLWDVNSIMKVEKTLRGHTNTVMSASFSPDGKYVVSASYDHTIRLWDVEKQKQVGEPLKGHKNVVSSVSFSPDGNFIVSASADSTVRIWDVKTGRQVGNPLKGHADWVHYASFSPDGKYIVSASGDVRVWDAKSHKQIGKPLEGHYLGANSASFSPDGKYIVSASRDIRIWDMKTHELKGKPLEGHDGFVESASFSPDGKYIVSASYDKTIRIWDVKTGKQVGDPLKGHAECARSASFSPDGKYIVSASDDHTIRIWNAKTREQVGTLEGHTNFVMSASFSPDGKYIVSASKDGTIRIWDFLPLQQLIDETQKRFKERKLSIEERQKFYLE